MTTIQPPTGCARRLAAILAKTETPLIVVGDRKGPPDYPLDGAQFLSLADQLSSPFQLAQAMPVNHYSRKNVGYLVAFAQGATSIYETDDDNAPADSWEPRYLWTRARRAPAGPKWVNIYRLFSSHNIWPRGFPLDLVAISGAYALNGAASDDVEAPIQQGLADLSPDVDAIWRLALNEDFYFDRGESVMLAPGTWCPFNSQTTWWWPVVYPLMYLPCYCSIRMTDIWRGFVAQRCLWALGHGLVFHAAEVEQERNEHNYLKDFEDEIPGYLQNSKIIAILESLSLGSSPDDVSGNMRSCYQALADKGILPEKEMTLVDAWVKDIAVIRERTVTVATADRG
jgi:hypothetical protein